MQPGVNVSDWPEEERSAELLASKRINLEPPRARPRRPQQKALHMSFVARQPLHSKRLDLVLVPEVKLGSTRPLANSQLVRSARLPRRSPTPTIFEDPLQFNDSRLFMKMQQSVVLLSK
jgi:hypothetical protein